MKTDERCPCLICAVQVVCTEYCTRFHFYRKLVIAEIEFFISQVIQEYNSEDKSLISELKRDLKIAQMENIKQGLGFKMREYVKLKCNLTLLESRFDLTIQNSGLAKRGIMSRLENEDDEAS